jgi:Tat protein secretion system quality control protein TatD with DNase activity
LKVQGRYKFSVPGFVYMAADRVAKIKNVPVDTVLAASRSNVEQIYRF